MDGCLLSADTFDNGSIINFSILSKHVSAKTLLSSEVVSD